MGRVNKSIKLKSKTGVAKAAGAIRAIGLKTNFKAKSKPSPAKDDKSKLLLSHKTIAPKTTARKKDKFRQKHKNLMDKFALIKKKRKEENARKNREKTAVIGDLKPLKDALPSLDELFVLSKKNGDIKTGVKEFDEEQVEPSQKLSVKLKFRKKKEKFIKKVNSYQALLNDPDFKKNPRDAIAYHIKYTHGLVDE